jgi:hypothetical protein
MTLYSGGKELVEMRINAHDDDYRIHMTRDPGEELFSGHWMCRDDETGEDETGPCQAFVAHQDESNLVFTGSWIEGSLSAWHISLAKGAITRKTR